MANYKVTYDDGDSLVVDTDDGADGARKHAETVEVDAVKSANKAGRGNDNYVPRAPRKVKSIVPVKRGADGKSWV